MFYFDDLLAQLPSTTPLSEGLFEDREVDPDRTLIILHSSGTTGASKKVLYSEKNVAWATEQYKKLYQLDINRTVAYMLPVNCTLGIVACGLTPLLFQREIVFEDPKNLEDLLSAIEKYKINILPAVPLMYKYMVHLDLNKYDLSSLQICDSGGEVLPISIIERFKASAGVTITEGYGQTETTSLTHFLMPDEEGNLRLGSVGRPCENVECKILNSSGEDAKPQEIGELWVRGPMVMKGYDKPELNQGVLMDDGWFNTGDMVYTDEEGFYYIACRRKDLNQALASFAKPLRQIEEIMYKIPGVIESASLINDKEQLLLYVKPVNNSPRSTEKLAELIKAQLAAVTHLKLLRVSFVAAIPRTATGKIKKAQLENV